MVLANDIGILQETDFFNVLSTEQLRLLAFGAKRRDVLAGEVLYKRGDRAKGAYVLIEGSFEVLAGDSENSVVYQVDEIGAVFGEIALILETDRPTTIAARERSMVLFIPRPAFLRLLEEYPETAVVIADKIRDRMDRFVGQLSGTQLGSGS